jgi:hypothetical protein
VANHLRLNLNLVELLSGVDTDDTANHLGDDNHVTEVGLDKVGLLVGLGLLLGLAELLDQAHGLALETAVESSTGTSVDKVTELLRAKVEEPMDKSVCPYRRDDLAALGLGNVLVEVDATVGKLAERSLPLKLCGVSSARVPSQMVYPIFKHSDMYESDAERLSVHSFIRGRLYSGQIGSVFVGVRYAYQQPPRRSATLLATSASACDEPELTYSESAMFAICRSG